MRKISILAVLLVIIVSGSVVSGEITWNVTNNYDQFTSSVYMGFDYINIENGRIYSQPGYPALPSLAVQFSIPRTSQVLSAVLEDVQWENAGTYNIMPAQELVPFGAELTFTNPNQEVYSTDSYFPEDQINNWGTGNKSGFMIGWIVYTPFRYNPASGKLDLMVSAKIVLTYEEGLEEVVYLTRNQLEVFSEGVKDIVVNPYDIAKNSPFIKDARFDEIEYVIVTEDNLINSFQPLIDWKIQKGISAKVVSIDWITSNYTGYYDDMESIREFVKDYHQNHGLIYFIMGGDESNLGARMVKIHNGSENDFTPCDLYFSDVVPYTSNWDYNGNRAFGELYIDGCDWYSDVYVGRFLVTDTTEVDIWINKLLTYEQNPPSGYLESSLMGGAGLWPPYYGDKVCDSIADNHLPSWWSHTKMYENQGVNSGFDDSLSNGYGWCHIAGHGNKDGVYWHGAGSMIQSGDNITNGMKLGVIHSIACQPGWIDGYTCVGEYYFNYLSGGAIAIMFNARYGWGSPPYLGPSEWLDIWTAMEVFDNENWNIGVGHGLGKDHIIPGMTSSGHWCLTELNLFGDPEMQIYSREPIQMNVTNSSVINIGNGNLSVNVSSSRGPVQDAVCCLSRQGDTTEWFKDITDANGDATIQYFISNSDPMYLTVYAHDCLYYYDTVNIAASGSYVYFIDIDSISGGFNNNQINSGADYEMSILVSNYGNQMAYNVKAVMSSGDPNIIIDQDTLVFGNISSNDTVASTNTCGFSIVDSLSDSCYIPIILTCFDQNDSSWVSNFGIYMNSPDVNFVDFSGPLTVLPGDNVYFWPKLANYGSGDAYNIDIVVRTDDPYISFTDSMESLTSILNGEAVWVGSGSAFNLDVSSSCPVPYWIDIELHCDMFGGFNLIDTFTLCIGEGFSDDFENGSSNWLYNGPSSWHITENRFYSSSHSMYCGEEGTWVYSAPVVNSWVMTDTMKISSSSELTFWHFYEIADNSDKIQVQITTDGGNNWNLLYPDEGYTGVWNYPPYDSIYTGDHRVWHEQHFDLSVDGNAQIGWMFFSNPTGVAEGYYFDDVFISMRSGFVGVEEELTGPVIHTGYQFALHRAYPNPVRGRAMISYSVGSEVSVRLVIYDLTGREVSTLVNQVQTAGNYRIEWDGRDSYGHQVSSGTYFYRMTAGTFTASEKLIVVR